MTFDHMDDEIFRSGELIHIDHFDFSLVVRIEDFFFHHSFADGSHLRTAIRIYDRSNDVSAESRTDLV